MKKILIIGATSKLAQETALLFAKQVVEFYLLARNLKKLELVAKNLKIAGAKSVVIAKIDVVDNKQLAPAINKAFSKMKNFEIILIAHGSLSNQKLCEENLALLQQEQQINALSTIFLLTIIAKLLNKNTPTVVAVITSLADEWVGAKNYIYASAKGMVTIFLKGLRAKFSNSKITILELKPGLVVTPMTKDLRNKKFAIRADFAAKKIVAAINKRKKIVYIPYYWKLILLIINKIPTGILKRLNL